MPKTCENIVYDVKQSCLSDLYGFQNISVRGDNFAPPREFSTSWNPREE